MWHFLSLSLQLGPTLEVTSLGIGILTVAWTFLSLIMLSTYTANLAAHLTAKIPTTEFESIKDLSHQNIPLYIPNSPNYKRFFNIVHSDEFQRINEKNQFWKSSSEIPYHLRKGRAIFASQRAYDVIKRQNCSQTFRTFGQSGVSQKAFALRKNHPLFQNISRKILDYLANGVITEIINRYKPKCSVTKKNNILPRSNLENMKGLLAVTASMALFGGFLMIAEYLLKKIIRPDTIEHQLRVVAPARPVLACARP